MLRWSVWWLAVIAAWTLLASVFAVSSSLTYMLAYQPPQWRQTFLMACTEWHVWAAMTPLVVWLARRLMLRRRRWMLRAVILAAIGIQSRSQRSRSPERSAASRVPTNTS